MSQRRPKMVRGNVQKQRDLRYEKVKKVTQTGKAFAELSLSAISIPHLWDTKPFCSISAPPWAPSS